MNRRLTQAAVFIENAFKEAVSSQRDGGPLIKHHHRMLQLHHQMHVCFPLLVIFGMAGTLPAPQIPALPNSGFLYSTPAIKKKPTNAGIMDEC